MNATQTRKPTPVQVRKGIAQEIAGYLESMARDGLKVGALLNKARDTFKKDETAAFLKWSEVMTGLGKSATYQYMQAATTVANVPEAEGLPIRSLSELHRFTPDETRAVLKQAGVGGKSGKQPTAAALRDAAAVVIDREKVKRAAADEKRESKEKESRDANTQAVDAVARKVKGPVRKALAGLFVTVEEDPHGAILLALQTGANLAKHGANVGPAVAKVIAEYIADQETPDDGETEESEQ